MAKSKMTEGTNGKPLHFSVGALIKKSDKYLLIDRAVPPLGFAGLAGHIDEGEAPEEALQREVHEESRLNIIKHKLLLEEELDWNWCSEGIGRHYWYLYECEVEGDVEKSDSETKSIGWYSIDEIRCLTLEPAWEYWFKKLKIL